MRPGFLSRALAAVAFALAAPAAQAQHPLISQLSTVVLPDAEQPALTARYFLSSLVASGIGAGAIALTANPGGWTPAKRWHAYIGIASGVAAIALSAPELDGRGDTRALATVNGIIGTASLTLGVRALLTIGEAERRTAQQQIGVAPLVTVGLDAKHRETAAVGGVVRIPF